MSFFTMTRQIGEKGFQIAARIGSDERGAVTAPRLSKELAGRRYGAHDLRKVSPGPILLIASRDQVW
jgi:hypothetical protein